MYTIIKWIIIIITSPIWLPFWLLSKLLGLIFGHPSTDKIIIILAVISINLFTASIFMQKYVCITKVNVFYSIFPIVVLLRYYLNSLNSSIYWFAIDSHK